MTTFEELLKKKIERDAENYHDVTFGSTIKTAYKSGANSLAQELIKLREALEKVQGGYSVLTGYSNFKSIANLDYERKEYPETVACRESLSALDRWVQE